MKTLHISLILVLAVFRGTLFSQDCNLYVPADVGTKWEVTNYNAKGKVESISKFELVDKVEKGNDVTFKVKSSSHDKKGKEEGSFQFEAFCKDGLFEFDMDYFLNSLQSEAYKDMNVEVEMEMTDFEMARFSDPVGTKLDDHKITMSMNMEGMGSMSMEMTFTDKEVVAKESKTTPAGTFDCIVISQTMSSKVSIMDVKISSKDWYSAGIGMVRNETYSENGKLTSYSELTSLTY